jgi:NTP pyrophosphatase (non-canonical NTP hydrolase)
MRKTYSFSHLVSLMARLRGPRGCPWDRKQTHQTLLKYLKEESAEVADAVRKGNPDHLCEELGDLLLQILFHSQIAAEKKRFTVNDVVDGLAKKTGSAPSPRVRVHETRHGPPSFGPLGRHQKNGTRSQKTRSSSPPSAMTGRSRRVLPVKKTVFRAVFFDAGNTLVRAHPSVGHIYAHTARRHGVRGFCRGRGSAIQRGLEKPARSGLS